MLELSSNNVPYLGEFYSKSKIAEIQKTSDFLNYSNNIEGQNPMIFPDAPSAPHAAIHIFIGGEMPHSVYAANEPLFFLHHAHIDKLWADWQRQDWKNRKRAYHGNVSAHHVTQDTSIFPTGQS
ncbi:hypothetical protein PGTUg99_001615 [Puccinia graminis f. sp. tritici]|uniref:Tyrosinase copper-binding domain-containing protein n=1 Tax=Puccinia graminis f. sp. tritici TaxID=56615 RepID=A0A5B0PPH6_PUCGR|nr:hypothetical protein PGTUg99_001615 [Puccinia graminis f. sp. tritici]